MMLFDQEPSVPEVVRGIIAGNPVYLQALQLGIANYTALANRIKPQVENALRTKVNTNTIVVAIKRFADAMPEEKDQSAGGHGTKAKLSLVGGILDVDLQRGRDNTLSDLLDKAFGERSGSYNLFQSDEHSTLLVEDAEEVREMMSGILDRFDGTLSEGLSKISIAIGEGGQDPYQVLSIVSGILYNNIIPIRSAFYTGNEIILVLNDNDAAKAYDLIRMRIG